ncbi:hypothetical protein LIER_35111 [Lithospermum erythrorhizon]|uniref:Reverse transcriptase domain-containing protein n=1 Tax=Lithospermum erythrorhizon TaxID=34254 RepID=A0AAV3NL04_LITER
MARHSSYYHVVLNLDMSKAFNRISEIFFEVILKRFSFCKKRIDSVLKCIKLRGFSVIIDGESKFLQSQVGVRQGGTSGRGTSSLSCLTSDVGSIFFGEGRGPSEWAFSADVVPYEEASVSSWEAYLAPLDVRI